MCGKFGTALATAAFKGTEPIVGPISIGRIKTVLLLLDRGADIKIVCDEYLWDCVSHDCI